MTKPTQAPEGRYSPRRDWSKSRIPPITVNAKDCTILLDGVDTILHPGETFRIVPAMTSGQSAELVALLRRGEDQPEPEYRAAVWRVLREDHLIDWTWTDMFGDPLPQPQTIEDASDILTSEEIAAIYYGVLRRGSKKPPLEADPNALPPTPDGS